MWDAWQVLAGKQAVYWAEQALKGSVVHMARATPQLAGVPDWQQSRHTLCCAWHSLQKAAGLLKACLAGGVHTRRGSAQLMADAHPWRQQEAINSPLLPTRLSADASTSMVLTLTQSSSHQGIAVGHEHALQHAARPSTLQQHHTGGVGAAWQQRCKGDTPGCRGSSYVPAVSGQQGSCSAQEQHHTGGVRQHRCQAVWRWFQ